MGHNCKRTENTENTSEVLLTCNKHVMFQPCESGSRNGQGAASYPVHSK